jgi:predicted transcriptional regulator
MSIRPKYAQAIIDGKKQYEYRKRLPKRTDIDKLYVYASKPIKAIIAYFTIGSVISDNPQKVWELTKKDGGITKKQFNEYFKGRDIAHAIEIRGVTKFVIPINPKQVIQGFITPQNFCYVDRDLENFHSASCINKR